MLNERRGFEVTKEKLIPARRHAIAAYAMDPANDLAWIRGTQWVRVPTEGPVELGTRVDRKAAFLGWRFSYTLEVIDVEPSSRVVMRAVAGPLPMTVSYEFKDAEGGTLTRIAVMGDEGFPKRLVLPVFAAAAWLTLARSLRALEHSFLGT